jgi:hypothetical protein
LPVFSRKWGAGKAFDAITVRLGQDDARVSDYEHRMKVLSSTLGNAA